MNETIRKEQINWLSQSLKSGATFNATLNRSSKEGHAMSLIATHGQWYLTEEDLNEILGSNNRGIKGKIEGEYLYLWIPDYKEEKVNPFKSFFDKKNSIGFFNLPIRERFAVLGLLCLQKLGLNPLRHMKIG